MKSEGVPDSFPSCNLWLELKGRIQGYCSISHRSQMFCFQTLLPSGNADDAGHGQPLLSSIWITNGFCLVFLLCVFIYVRWDLWRSVIQPLLQHNQHLSQTGHSGSCPGELLLPAGTYLTCSPGILLHP